jgi:hypothetical protein
MTEQPTPPAPTAAEIKAVLSGLGKALCLIPPPPPPRRPLLVVVKSEHPPAPSTNGARDREMLERLDRMMGHILRRNPNDHTADIVAREIAEHLELYPFRGPLT